MDHFNNTVDNKGSLPDIQKVHYLKAVPTDEPSRLLAYQQVTGSNYDLAKTLLKERYYNKRLIASSHIDSILKFISLKSGSASQLRQELHTWLLENVLALLNLKLEEEERDYRLKTFHKSLKMDAVKAGSMLSDMPAFSSSNCDSFQNFQFTAFVNH